MVGIVIVSHSEALAESLKALANQVSKNKVSIATAGGIDDESDPVGTDAMKILTAIQEVYSEDGVIIFMDLGSAILSTDTALDFVDDSWKQHIHLSSAPLVEGVIAATVQAAAGIPLNDILSEAEHALQPKQSQLGKATQKNSDVILESKADQINVITETYKLRNTLGLHARPAARIVTTCAVFDAEARIRNVTKSGIFVNAKSMNSLITLNAVQGNEVEIQTSGAESMQLQSKLGKMFNTNFGESTAPLVRKSLPRLEEQAAARSKGYIEGISVAPGYAVGPVKHYEHTLPSIIKESISDVEAEIKKLKLAIEKAKAEVIDIIEEGTSTIAPEDAAIFEAQILLIQDPELLSKVEKRIKEERIAAPYAWRVTLDEFIAIYEAATSGSQLSTRVADLIDVGLRVLEKLTGESYNTLEVNEPVILITEELNPSDVASIDTQKILAICTTKGSENSHSAILARSLGIPSVFGMGKLIREIPEGNVVAVDGELGMLYTRPESTFLSEMEKKRADWLEIKVNASRERLEPAKTEDGIQLDVMANVGSLADVYQAIEQGAEGIGLFRTEFVFMTSGNYPSEDDQFAMYSRAAALLDGKPLVIRTIDIGGDKPVPYLNIEKEDNPFLGWRGIRYSLDQAELFKTQLRAILRASTHGNVSVMFPMLSTLDELNRANLLLHTCKKELSSNNIPFDVNIKSGIMVEVPAAVTMLNNLLEHTDFISIGTNDLTQYIMAADRTNSRVAELSSHYQPAVIHTIADIVQKAQKAGKHVSMCGEMARDTRLTALLAGLGLRSFSMSSNGIPEFKWRARKLNLQHSSGLSETILGMKDVKEVKSTLQQSIL
jgi:phosphoenolpyruvate-protein phosphotransferase/dihydroxyacetone kinase phosphotransfer subunit